LPALLAGMNGPDGQPAVDVMIGSRYVAGGGVVNWPLRRKLMSRAVNFYARTLLGLSPRDCSGSYRCYRTSLLARLDFDAVRSRGYSFQEEILWHLKRLGARFGETPITFEDRRLGKSKIDSKEAWQAMRIILSLALFGAKPRPSG
jgi:dolichol-phosphate mannosyltransferase